jgi:hypothetical protein
VVRDKLGVGRHADWKVDVKLDGKIHPYGYVSENLQIVKD